MAYGRPHHTLLYAYIWLVLLYFLTGSHCLSVSSLEPIMQTKMAFNRDLPASVHHKACMAQRVPSPLYPWGRSGLIKGCLRSHLLQCPLGPALTSPLKSPPLQGSAQPVPFGPGDFLRTSHLGPSAAFVGGVRVPKRQPKTMKGAELT